MRANFMIWVVGCVVFSIGCRYQLVVDIDNHHTLVIIITVYHLTMIPFIPSFSKTKRKPKIHSKNHAQSIY